MSERPPQDEPRGGRGVAAKLENETPTSDDLSTPPSTEVDLEVIRPPVVRDLRGVLLVVAQRAGARPVAARLSGNVRVHAQSEAPRAQVVAERSEPARERGPIDFERPVRVAARQQAGVDVHVRKTERGEPRAPQAGGGRAHVGLSDAEPVVVPARPARGRRPPEAVVERGGAAPQRRQRECSCSHPDHGVERGGAAPQRRNASVLSSGQPQRRSAARPQRCSGAALGSPEAPNRRGSGSHDVPSASRAARIVEAGHLQTPPGAFWAAHFAVVGVRAGPSRRPRRRRDPRRRPGRSVPSKKKNDARCLR